MEWIPVTVIVGYLALTTFLGSWLSRRTKDSSSWAIASGQLGLLMVAVGVAGTRIGGVGTYGVAGDVMQSGLWNLWYGVNTLLALALVGAFFAIPYRRLRLHTVAEIFLQRFDSKRCQVLTSLCVQTEYLIVNILEPFVIGSILSAVTGIPFGIAVMIGALVIVAYTSLGGLLGSAVTNMLHCAVVIFGLGALCLVALQHLGGWSEVQNQVGAALAAAEPPIDKSRWWSFVGRGLGSGVCDVLLSHRAHAGGFDLRQLLFRRPARARHLPGLLPRRHDRCDHAHPCWLCRPLYPCTLRCQLGPPELSVDHSAGGRHSPLAGRLGARPRFSLR